MIENFIRPATLQDALDISIALRPEDRDEIEAGSGLTPAKGLIRSLALSTEAYTMHKDGELAGMFGVTETQHPIEGVGGVWLLATPVLVENWRPFLRYSREGLLALHARYPALWAFADARNDLHIKWLGWLGFTTIKVHPEYGHEKRPFVEVMRVHQNV